MTQYYFLILGLDFDIVPDVASAKKVIIAKTNYWNDDQRQIGKNASYYASLAEQAQRMKNVLSEQAALEKHAHIAADVAYPVIDKLLKEAAGAGQGIDASKMPGLCTLARKEVAHRCALPFVEISDRLIERRAGALGIDVGSISRDADAAAAYERYAKNEPVGIREFNLLDADLAPLGKRDLYEFACPPGETHADKLPPDKLLAQARETLNGVRNDPALKSSAEKLMPAVESIIGSPVKRYQYDAFLQWREVNAALESAGQLADLCGGVLGGQNARDARARIARRIGEETAELVLAGYCAARTPKLVYGGTSDKGSSSKDKQDGQDVIIPAVSCGASSLSMLVGETRSVPLTCTGGKLGVHAADKGILAMGLSDDSTSIIVKGIAPGKTTIKVSLDDMKTSLVAYAKPIEVTVLRPPRKKTTVSMDTTKYRLRIKRAASIRVDCVEPQTAPLTLSWENGIRPAFRSDDIEWAEDHTISVTPRYVGTCRIDVYVGEDETYEKSNVVHIEIESYESVLQKMGRVLKAFRELTWWEKTKLGCGTYILLWVIYIVLEIITSMLGF